MQYNGGVAFTPNLDAMASGEHSIRFDRFYSSSPVCSPTRGSLLTGRNHNRYCVWMANTAGRNCKNKGDFLCEIKNPLPLSEVTVAELLKEQGYRTAVIGKWHLGGLVPQGKQPSNPGQNGFDVWKVTERAVPTSTSNCGCFNTSFCNLGHYQDRGPPPCTNYYSPGSANESHVLKAHPEIILKDDSEFVVDEFSDFLKETRNNGQTTPFFAYIPFHSVHKKYIATPPYDALYADRTFRREEVDYYASISAMDTAVGRIRTLLKHYNVSSNTMLWFASDNGPAEKSPGSTQGLRGSKGSLFEGGIRVPGIIEWPGVIKQNRVSTYPVTTSDFVPTVVDALGIQNSTHFSEDHKMDGTSILHLLQGRAEGDNSTEGEIRNDTIKWAFNIRGDFSGHYTAVIMDNHHKLMASYRKGLLRNVKLYNLNEDPTEAHDVSQQNVALSARLLLLLEEWLDSVQTSAREEVACLTNTT